MRKAQDVKTGRKEGSKVKCQGKGQVELVLKTIGEHFMLFLCSRSHSENIVTIEGRKP